MCACLSLSLYVYACICVDLMHVLAECYVHICVYIYIEARRQLWSWLFFFLPAHWTLQEFLSNRAQEPACFYLLALELEACVLPHLAFYICIGSNACMASILKLTYHPSLYTMQISSHSDILYQNGKSLNFQKQAYFIQFDYPPSPHVPEIQTHASKPLCFSKLLVFLALWCKVE